MQSIGRCTPTNGLFASLQDLCIRRLTCKRYFFKHEQRQLFGSGLSKAGATMPQHTLLFHFLAVTPQPAIVSSCNGSGFLFLSSFVWKAHKMQHFLSRPNVDLVFAPQSLFFPSLLIEWWDCVSPFLPDVDKVHFYTHGDSQTDPLGLSSQQES